MKHKISIIVIMLIISFNLLLLATFYYDMTNQLKNMDYVNDEEYSVTSKGVQYIEDIPFHFYFKNKAFSDFKKLDANFKDEILFSYILENKGVVYDCYDTKCVNVDDLGGLILSNPFKIEHFELKDNYQVFIDGIGFAKYIKYNDYYKLDLSSILYPSLKKYVKFKTYAKNDNNYLFYAYVGYSDDDNKLYDFISGDEVKSFEELSLYKFIFRMDSDSNLYLIRFNPVKEIDI